MSGNSEEETNVRVAARVRPLLPRERAANCCSCISVQKSTRQVVMGTQRAFAFDEIFDSDATQSEVYKGCVEPLLNGCLQGYNATVFAYGQTGSGKTHTMGTANSAARGVDDEGITPRVIRNSFEHMERRQGEVDFQASCCYMEIYNEEIRDLLQPRTTKNTIAVRETADGVIQVAGIHAERCSSAQEMLQCLNNGSVQRTTGATLMNEHSSRSHSIFTIILEQRARGQPEDNLCYRNAKFHLVDLAGSERAKRTGAVGSRLKESVAINAGLLALGNVISALGDPAKRGCHVPYRDSKLTRLLQDSLGGNSRTWMLACVSCADGDFEETMNTLKYAHRARNIKNRPIVNHDPRAAQLVAMQDEIKALRSELRRVSEGTGVPGTLASTAEDTTTIRLNELATKLENSEARCRELTEQIEVAESDREAARRALAEVYGTLCQHLPALWRPRGTAPECTGNGTRERSNQAAAEVQEALKLAHRVLSEGTTTVSPPTSPLPPLDDPGGSTPGGSQRRGSKERSKPREDEINLDASSAEGADASRLQSLSEMRRDSTLLIRKYLDEIKRLEGELTLYRRQTKQLQDELKEAREDLQKDEDIFDEKMQHMKHLVSRNQALESELQQLRGQTSPPKTPESQSSPTCSQSGRIGRNPFPFPAAVGDVLPPQLPPPREQQQQQQQQQSHQPSPTTRWDVVGPTEAMARKIEESDEVRFGDPPDNTSTGSACGGLSDVASMSEEDHVHKKNRKRSNPRVRVELAESRSKQALLENQLQELSSSAAVKEEMRAELERSACEWGNTRALYQRRMEEAQAELQRTQSQLAKLEHKLQEESDRPEAKRSYAEEHVQLTKRAAELMECMRKRQQEYHKLQELRHKDTQRIRDLEAELAGVQDCHNNLRQRLQHEQKRVARLEQVEVQDNPVETRQNGFSQRGSKEHPVSRRSSKEQAVPRKSSNDSIRSQDAFENRRGSKEVAESRRSSKEGHETRRSSKETVEHRRSSKEAPCCSPSGQQEQRRSSKTHSNPGSAFGSRVASDSGSAFNGNERMGGSSSSSSQPHQLEQKIDDHLRRHEASESLEEDKRRRQALLQKKDQYLALRQDITAKHTKDQAKATEKLREIEAQLVQIEKSGDIGPNAHSRVSELRNERKELQRAMQKMSSANKSMLQDVEERLEGLQDEIDYREAQITRLQQTLKDLDVELVGVSGENAKEMLAKYHEEMLKIRQREKQSSNQLAEVSAQLEDRTREVHELMQALRWKETNTAKEVNKVTKEYEARVRMLLKQRASATEPGEANNTLEAMETSIEIEQLRKDNEYFKHINRELKRTLHGLMERASANGGDQAHQHIECLAAQIDRLQQEKEALRAENAQVMQQVQKLKQHTSRFLGVTSGGPLDSSHNRQVAT